MQFVTACMVQRVNVRHCTKFCVDRSNRCWEMAICRFMQNGDRPPSWIFVICTFRPLTTSILCYLSLRKIWLKSMQYSFDNTQVWHENAYSHTQMDVFWGTSPTKWRAVTSRPQKAPTCAEAAFPRSLDISLLICERQRETDVLTDTVIEIFRTPIGFEIIIAMERAPGTSNWIDTVRYLRQWGYVFVVVCLFVCLSVSNSAWNFQGSLAMGQWTSD